MLYPSVASHPLLGGPAKKDASADQPRLNAQQELAELLLGFSTPTLTDAEQVAVVAQALVMQVNWQYAIKDFDPFIYTSRSSKAEATGISFRDDVTLVNPMAQSLADLVLVPTEAASHAQWAELTSFRGPRR